MEQGPFATSEAQLCLEALKLDSSRLPSRDPRPVRLTAVELRLCLGRNSEELHSDLEFHGRETAVEGQVEAGRDTGEAPDQSEVSWAF